MFLKILLFILSNIGSACTLQTIRPLQWQTICWNGELIYVYYLPPYPLSTTPISRIKLSQYLYKKLAAIPPVPTNTLKNKAYIISPESTFPYSLTKKSREFELWQSMLPFGAAWIWGGSYKNKKGDLFQSLFLMQNGLITERFEKTVLIPFFEAAPLTHLQAVVGAWLFPPLQSHELLFKEGRSHKRLLSVPARPILCCELLCYRGEDKEQGRGLWVFSKETWLSWWLQAVWKWYAVFVSRWSCQPLLWVGHTECFIVC